MKIKAQRNNGIYSFMKLPKVYLNIQKLLGMNKFYEIFVNKYLNDCQNKSILDIGCGTAEIVSSLPPNIRYVGFDINSDYIKFAKQKYGNQITLFNSRVADFDIQSMGQFDYVICIGIIHHLDDCETDQLFKIGFRALRLGGKMITVDNAFIRNQRLIPKMISKMDRGKFVRFAEEYQKLSLMSFTDVNQQINTNLSFIPQDACILICKK